MNANLTEINKNQAHLLVDIEHGVVLDSPPQAIKSRRWAESHPFVEFNSEHLVAGPDATAAIQGVTNAGDYVRYAITREVAGFLHLERVA